MQETNGKSGIGDVDLEKGSHLEPHRRTNEIVNAIDPPLQENEQLSGASSLVDINEPPSEPSVESEDLPPSIHEAPRKTYPPLSFSVITSLIPGSLFGVLARLGLLAITTYDGESIFPLAWVQATGCFIMGFALGMREPVAEYYGPLYTAITTGLCGSITTFSSWQLDVFISWANTKHAHRDWFRDVIDGLSKTVFTLAIALGSLTLGLHLARPVARHMPHIRRASVSTRYVFRIICILMYVVTIPIYFKASPAFRHQATAALLFSFPGTLTRYLLAVKLTPLVTLFPLGTFIANTAGTALLGVFHVLQRTSTLPSHNGCAILQGLIDGYCGCLTTVSTFAVEVDALKAKKAWFYVALSWGVSQLLLLIIFGSSWWGANVDESRMCTYA